MNKEETYAFLKENNIEFEAVEHKAVFNMDELDTIELPHPEWEAKNLFVRDDKKRNYYLITVKGAKRVDLKEFRQKHGLRALSFASADDLLEIMKLTPGSVTPLGLLILIFKLKVYKKSSKISNIWVLRRFFVYTLIKN